MVPKTMRPIQGTPNTSEGYKTTELGPLPEEWEVVRLGKLLEKGKLFVRNGFPQGAHNQAGQGVPHLRPFNVSNDGSIELSQIKYVTPPPENSPYWIRPGDIVFNNTNSEDLVGKTAYFSLDGKYVLSNHMTLIRVLDNEAIDTYWFAKELHYLWESRLFRALCRRHVNQASVSLERLKGVLLPLPPRLEQRAIAHMLRTVQQAKEATEKVIVAVQELKKSLMRHLFTYGPVPVEEAERVPLKETEIGPVPEHWEVVRLGEVTKSSAFGPRFSAEFYDSSGNVATLRTTDISEAGCINYSTMPLARLEMERFAHHLLKPGDFLVTRSGTCGIGAVFEGHNIPVLPGAFLIRIRPDERVLPSILREYFNSDLGQRRVSSLAAGAVQKNISGTALKGFHIPLPPLPEQREISRILSAVDVRISAEENRRRALEALFKSLLHHLMMGKLRVASGPEGTERVL